MILSIVFSSFIWGIFGNFGEVAIFLLGMVSGWIFRKWLKK